ncbi:MAG: hypothetical protein RLO37_04100 [Coleofasciculus chthonoplastes F1-TOW-03]
MVHSSIFIGINLLAKVICNDGWLHDCPDIAIDTSIRTFGTIVETRHGASGT